MAKFLKKLKDFASDVGNTVAYSVTAPVRSVTGKKKTVKYKTKVGKVLGTGSNIGNDSLHIIGKAAGDVITFGNATKLANKFRKEENKEKAFDYNEMKTWHKSDTGIKAIDMNIDRLQKGSKVGALVLGQAVGSTAVVSGVTSNLPTADPTVAIDSTTAGDGEKQLSTGGGILVAGAIAAALLLK